MAISSRSPATASTPSTTIRSPFTSTAARSPRGGNPETQAKIEQILQLDAESFVTAVMFPQGAEGFVSLADAAQKAILDKILGTNRFAEAQERSKKRLKKAVESLGKLKVATSVKKNHISQLQASLASLQNQDTRFDTEKKQRIDELKQALDLLHRHKPGVEMSIDVTIASLRQQIAGYNLQPLYAQLQTKQQEYQETDKQLATEKARLQTLQSQVANAGPEPERPLEDLAKAIQIGSARLRVLWHASLCSAGT